MDFLKYFLDSLKEILNKTADVYTYVIVAACIGISLTALIIKYLKIRKATKTRTDLHPYFDEEKISLAKKYYISTQCQDRPPEIDAELSDSDDVSNKSNLINFFFKQVFNTTKQRFYLILGDAGMGKTTFMINLFLKYNSGLFPKDYNMFYIPLTFNDADERIDLLKPLSKSTILLLDAFDEDPKAFEDWETRMNEIIIKVQDFRKVIITCRTQFFPNEEKIPYQLQLLRLSLDTEVHTLNKKHISPFTDKEVKKYLTKKYGRAIMVHERWLYYNQRRVKANGIVSMAPNLTVRPMLLDKIDDLLLSGRKLEYDYQVFEELVFLWIERESRKQLSSMNISFKKDMYDFLLYAAIKIYKNFRDGLGLFISTMEIEKIASDKNITLKLVDMTSRSLLNKNPDGRIKFSHKTILEYFLALVDAEQIDQETINFNSFTYGVKLRRQILKKRLTEIYHSVLISSDGRLFMQLKISDRPVDYIETIMLESSPYNKLHYFRLFPSLKYIYICNEVSKPHPEKKFAIETRIVKETAYPFYDRNVSVLIINGDTYNAVITNLEIQVNKARCFKIEPGSRFTERTMPTVS